MNENYNEKKYESCKIPDRKPSIRAGVEKALQRFEERGRKELQQYEEKRENILPDDCFYEIEYGSSPIPGVGKFVLKTRDTAEQHTKLHAADSDGTESAGRRNRDIEPEPPYMARAEKLTPPVRDEVRELFYQMRAIERKYHIPLSAYTQNYEQRVESSDAKLFYHQAIFMKDFEDNYKNAVPMSRYFPCYQRMGYEQLRTYFTWRTRVRQGFTNPVSVSYAFLYLYELLNNVGVDSPQEGMDRILQFWVSYRCFDATIDKYLVSWLKEYFIYYGLSGSFRDFISEYGLEELYPEYGSIEKNKKSGKEKIRNEKIRNEKMQDDKKAFAEKQNSEQFFRYCSVSRYNIRRSSFYGEENSKQICDCFLFVKKRLEQTMQAAGIDFEEMIFTGSERQMPWKPFQNACFYPVKPQPDRRVEISQDEIYFCHDNVWTIGRMIATETGKQLVSYVMKKTEAVLRGLSKYKYKLKADIKMLYQETKQELEAAGIQLDTLIEQAVSEYYQGTTRTVVTVDYAALERIRREAMDTQKALIVEEEMPSLKQPGTASERSGRESSLSAVGNVNTPEKNPEETEPELPAGGNVSTPEENLPMKERNQAELNSEVQLDTGWSLLKRLLTEQERKALAALLDGEDFKAYSDSIRVMQEVLADGINEKALDAIGDNILDEELALYDDYKEQVRGMVE